MIKLYIFFKILSFVLLLLLVLLIMDLIYFFKRKYKMKGKYLISFPIFIISISSLVFPSIYYDDGLDWLHYFGGIFSLIGFLALYFFQKEFLE